MGGKRGALSGGGNRVGGGRGREHGRGEDISGSGEMERWGHASCGLIKMGRVRMLIFGVPSYHWKLLAITIKSREYLTIQVMWK